MRTPELEARHRASAIVSRMFRTILRAPMGNFAASSISAVLPELLVAMAIRLNDGEGKPPTSLSEIARMTGIPRPTVQRLFQRLIERGVVLGTDGGIAGNDQYLLERIDAEYFKDAVIAIREAAKELENYK